MLDLVIYTVLTNNYDILLPPLSENEEYRHICFADKPYPIPGWEVKTFTQTENNVTRNSRKPKILSHLFIDTPYSLYHDANRQLKVDAQMLFEKYLTDKSIAFYTHPHRSCLYAEQKAVVDLHKDTQANTINQIERYKQEGFPVNYGLHSGGIILRKLCDTVIDFENLWWVEYCTGSQRDQLSLDYVRWKTGIEFGLIPGHYFGDEKFLYAQHKRRN